MKDADQPVAEGAQGLVVGGADGHNRMIRWADLHGRRWKLSPLRRPRDYRLGILHVRCGRSVFVTDRPGASADQGKHSPHDAAACNKKHPAATARAPPPAPAGSAASRYAVHRRGDYQARGEISEEAGQKIQQHPGAPFGSTGAARTLN